MDNFTLMLATSVFTALTTALILFVFVWLKPPKTEAKVKKLKQCPTCKKWSEVS